MPIKTTKPPKSLINLVTKHTAASKNVATLKAQHLGTQAALPHKIYTLEPKDILSGQGLEKAVHVGWRVFHPKNKDAALEAYCDSNGRNLTFGGINRGPFVQGTHEAIELANAHAAVDKSSFKLAILRIPALYVMALWLKHRNSDEDLFIAIPPTNHVIEPGRIYKPNEFWQRLHEAAKQRRDNPDAPRN